MTDNFEPSEGFIQINPKSNCPHCLSVENTIGALGKVATAFDANACSNCGDPRENWLCLTCFEVFCSRYVNSHGVQHYESAKHSVYVSFSDLSFWCYECDSYIRSPKLSAIKNTLHLAKHGSNDPSFAQQQGEKEEKIETKEGETEPKAPNNNDDSDSDSDVDDGLLKALMARLGITAKPASTEKHEPVLSSFDMAGVVEFIKSGKAKNIILMNGAGISVAAGIPDFRSPKTGLYHNLAKYDLPYAEAIFEIDYFRQKPEAFFTLAKELFPTNYDPTPCHYFATLLHKKGLLQKCFTQNIDTLERFAGMPEEKIVEAHGSFAQAHCIDCRKEFSQDWIKNEILAGKVARCECGGLVKPDIIFFGENLPAKFFDSLKEDFPKCDLLLIMGTSLKVQPFASLIGRVSDKVPRVLINMDAVGTFNPALAMLGDSGLMFERPDNYRDVGLLGDCQKIVKEFVDALGWTAEFEEMMKKKE
jgi:NAD-dependent SIR2 family protein deacetylase